MKKILFPVLMILFVIGGAIIGDFLKNKGQDNSATESHAPKKKAKKGDGHGADKKKDDGHGKDKRDKSKKKKSKKDKGKKDKGKKKKDKGHGKSKGGHGESSYGSSEVSYLKFKRQFVVPVMTQGKIDALVIMNLNLELNEDAPDNTYTLEPKLRDAITRELLALSNEGIFGENLTSAESYESLRRTVLSACRTIIPDGIKDILILDIARQEQ